MGPDLCWYINGSKEKALRGLEYPMVRSVFPRHRKVNERWLERARVSQFMLQEPDRGAWIIGESEGALPETDFRRYAQNGGDQDLSSG